MKKEFAVLVVLSLLIPLAPLRAGDLDDGISDNLEEPITADDKISDKEINLRFIVANALGEAKKGPAASRKIRTNFKDGKQDQNENSVVVEPGSNVDRIVNVVIQK